MKIEISREVYNLFKPLLKEKLREYLISKGVKKIKKTLIDSPKLADTPIFEYCFDDGSHALSEMVNFSISKTYFNKEKTNFRHNQYYIKFDDVIFRVVLTFLGYEGDSTIEQFRLLFSDKSLNIPESIIQYQETLFKNIEAEEKEVKKVPEKDQLSIASKRERFKELAETTWFLYFYGYNIKKEERDENEWRLIRLILDFKVDGRSDDLAVSITNSPHNKDHYNYKTAYIDTENSGDEVLVLNLRTEFNTRQLNIKVHIKDGTGGFFLGQYLNYEVRGGHIISGTLILEQAKENKPKPKVYKFKKGYESDVLFLNQIHEIRHIIEFFKDRKKNFRRTTTKVNSLNTFREWQKERKHIDMKRLGKYSEKIRMLVSKEIDISDMAKIFDVSDSIMAEYIQTHNM